MSTLSQLKHFSYATNDYKDSRSFQAVNPLLGPCLSLPFSWSCYGWYLNASWKGENDWCFITLLHCGAVYNRYSDDQ